LYEYHDVYQKREKMNKSEREFIPPGLGYIADNIISKHNLLGASEGTGVKWAEDLNLPRKADTIFYAGCGYQYTSAFEAMMSLIRKMDMSPVGAEIPIGIASWQKKLGLDMAGAFRKLMVRDKGADAQPLRDAVRVLKHLGVDIGYLAEDEPCCGGLLHYIGLENDFAENAARLHDRLESFGVKRIISIVPSCTFTLRNLIPRYSGGRDIEVKHFLEFLTENIGSLGLKSPREVKVTYHDPCQLARCLGLVEEPRQILGAIQGIELVEPDWTNREWATCCGGGGGFEAVFPEFSEILAVNRARELIETGAGIIVTHCPGCIMQLKHGLKKLKVEDVEVLDISQVVSEAMGG
jgi:hypothetical protein